MRDKLFKGNAIAFFVFSVAALRLFVTEHHKAGNFLLLSAGACFLGIVGIALGMIRHKKLHPFLECLIYYVIVFICYWATGLLGF